MTPLNPAQVADLLAIEQLINFWAKELDDNNGIGVGPMVTQDCAYSVPGSSYQGREAVVKYYHDRLAGLKASPEGVPVHRHVISNLCVDFTASDSASVSFLMTYYTALSRLSGNSPADPALVGNGDMIVRRETDGHWRIARLDTEAALVRAGGQVR